MAAGGAEEKRLVVLCVEAAAADGRSVEVWRRQRRTLERLPAALADALLRRLAARGLLFPSLLEVFQYSVEEIDLSGYSVVDAEWLAYLGGFRELRSLKLADCRNINNSAIWSLAGMGTLKELDLSRCKRITNAGIKHIISIETLEKLYISETDLTDDGVMLLSSLKNLTLLDLGGITMTDKALQSLEVLTGLEHLDIWGSRVTNDGASILATFKRLNFLNLTWTYVTRVPFLPSIRCLIMSSCKIHSLFDGDSQVNIPLEKLDVSSSSFSNINEICARIEASSLSFLDVSCCSVSSLVYIYESRCSVSNLDFLDKMTKLEHLNLTGTSITDDAIQHIANIGEGLKYLNFRCTTITSQAVGILAGTVTNLASLTLAYTQIDDSALVYISMMPSLATIDLSNTYIKGFTLNGDGSERILSLPALQNLNCLESLNLEDTPMQSEVIPPLASVRELKYLYLESSFLSDTALHVLSSAKNLVHLGFRGNILSNCGLLEFVPPALLKVLDIRGCWLLTEDAVSTFCNNHPKIEVQHRLVRENRTDQVGTSQPHKSKQVQQRKSKGMMPGPRRVSEVSFVDERIKYNREEMLELKDSPLSSSIKHDVQIPPELRWTE